MYLTMNPSKRHGRRLRHSEMDDTALLDLARRGDEQAFAQLFDRHSDGVFGYAAVRLRSRDAALDVVSYVFAEAWRQRHTIETQAGSLRPWLFAVARNCTARQITANLRRDHRGTVPEQRTPDHADRVAERLDASGVFPAVLEEIDRLPAGAREALTLHVWGAMTYEEIASELGVEVGTVKSRLSRARARLAKVLHPDDPSGPDAAVFTLYTPEDQT